MSQQQTYTISDLAREFGITPRAIRFYEGEGLLSPERAGSKRIYSKRDRTSLRLILRGKVTLEAGLLGQLGQRGGFLGFGRACGPGQLMRGHFCIAGGDDGGVGAAACG